MLPSDKAVYSITVEDLQTVARKELGRKLTDVEIINLEATLGDRIPWYDTIATALNEELRPANKLGS